LGCHRGQNEGEDSTYSNFPPGVKRGKSSDAGDKITEVLPNRSGIGEGSASSAQKTTNRDKAYSASTKKNVMEKLPLPKWWGNANQ